MTFSGPELSAELYFDIRYIAPGTSVEQVVLNWQHGNPYRHAMSASISLGKWLITGVRAHYNSTYHEGKFDPVKIVLEVKQGE